MTTVSLSVIKDKNNLIIFASLLYTGWTTGIVYADKDLIIVNPDFNDNKIKKTNNSHNNDLF